MNFIIALLSLALLALSTFFSEGSSRYFEVSPKAGIAPLEVTLNAEALKYSKKAETFIWEFGDGQKLTTSSPIIKHTFITAGTFTVKLQYLKNKQDKIKNAKDAGQVKIVVSPKPNILPIPQLSCVSNEVNKLECDSAGSTDSDGTIVSYKFDWGDSSTNDFTSAGVVSHQYQNAGEKTVRLTVTDNKGASAFIEKSFVLKANTPPVANFSCTKTGIQKIRCESTSTDNEENISNLAWSLDDGAVYNSASFDHTFNRPQDVAIAFHNVSLKVTDSLGLESSIAKEIEVDLEVIREAPRGYFKAFIDGTTVDLRAFIVKTQFNIKRATYQIYDAQNNLLHTLPISAFYQNHSTKINLENFENYRVTLTIVDYRDQQIVITRQIPLVEDTSALAPFVAFRAIQSNVRTLYLNLNQSFDYDENYSIREFIVNLGNGQTRTLTTDTFLTYTYPEAGTYTISVTAKTNHGTERTFSQPITITDSEVAPVMPDPTFAYRIYSFAQNVSFYNEKSGTPNGEIISYHWDFGDNTTATGETQAHFYMPGEYLVTLTVVDTAGYSSTQTQKISILAEGDDIVANIDCNQRQPYLDITQMCKVNALDKFNEINRIRVVWGDGAVFTLATPFDPRQGVYYPQKAYTAEGTYAVRLIVNTVRGAFKTHDISHTVTARRPVANIQCLTNNLLVFCDALGSYDPKGTHLTYEFDFGNGHSEINNSGVVTYAYQDAGLYDISVKVVDALEMSSIATTKVQVVRPPNILPVANLNCVTNRPLTLSCNAGPSFDPDGYIVSAKYEYDDGTVLTYDPHYFFDHRFVTAGEHLLKLTVIDNEGGVTTAESRFNVLDNNAPVVAFECRSEKPYELICASSSHDSDGFVVGRQWFVNGVETSFDGDYFQREFNNAEPVLIKLKLIDDLGKVAELEKEITPKENLAPVADALCQSSGPLNVTCQSLAYDPENSGGMHEEWSLNGEVLGYGGLLNRQLLVSGMQTITLKVIDFYGAVGMKDIHVVIQENQAPVADFDCYSSKELNLNCFSKSEDVDGDIVGFEWRIDDSVSYAGESFNHDFTIGEKHTVKLTVKDNTGAESTVEKEFNLTNKPPQFEIAVEQLNNTMPREVRFSAENVHDEDGEIAAIEWDLGNGIISHEQNLTHTFTEENYYIVKLKVTDNKGMANIKTTVVEVINNFEVVAEASEISGVAPLLVHFNQNLSPSSGERYEWYYRGELISEDYSFEYTFDTVGKHLVTLRVFNTEGRSSEKTIDVTTTQPPIYIGGDFTRNIFSGREIRIPFEVLSLESIPRENIQVLLDGAPEGVVVAGDSLVWTPTIEQAEKYEFKLVATDGILSSYRILRMNVVNPRTIFSKEIGSNGENIQINDVNSILNGAIITLPNSEANYAFSILEGVSSTGKHFLSFESDVDLKERFRIDYGRPIDITSWESSDHYTSDFSEYAKSQITTQEEYKCIDTGIVIKEYKETSLNSYTEKWSYGNTNVYYKPLSLENFSSFLKAQALLRKDLLPPTLKGQNKLVNIYLVDNIKTSVGALGIVKAGDVENISVSLDSLADFLLNTSYYRFILSHEYYHIIQNEMLSCEKINKMIYHANLTSYNKYRPIKESTANYFAFKDLASVNDFDFVSKMVPENSKYAPDFYFKNYLNVEERFLQDKDSPYQMGIFMDNVKYRQKTGFLNGYDFGFSGFTSKLDYQFVFNHMNEKFDEYNLYGEDKYTHEILKGAGKIMGVEYKDILLSATRDLSNGNPKRLVDKTAFVGTDILKFYKDFSRYPAWKNYENGSSFQEKKISNIRFPSSVSSIPSSNEISFNITIPPYSGEMKWFDYEGADNGLTSLGLPFFMTISSQEKDDPDISLEFNEVQENIINGAYIQEWKTGSHSVYHVISNLPNIGPGNAQAPVFFDHSSHSGKFYIAAANSSSNSKILTFKIKPACKVYDRLSDPGLSINRPFILDCREGDCWNGHNATSYFACKNSSQSLWDPGNCIAPRFAHPGCNELQPDGGRIWKRDFRYGADAQMVNDTSLEGNYRYIVLCRNPDFNESSTDINAFLSEINVGYSFHNYGTVNCEDVGL